MSPLTSLQSLRRSFSCLSLVGIASIFLAGCISHSETTYRSAERVKVQFENEKAGRVFYEALSRMHFSEAGESHTEVSIPIIFENKETIKTGENEKFNQAVRQCDTNKDGVITETEAEIFASQIH